MPSIRLRIPYQFSKARAGGLLITPLKCRGLTALDKGTVGELTLLKGGEWGDYSAHTQS